MSIGNLGFAYAASLAGTNNAEKQSHVDKNARENSTQERKSDSLERSAKAEGLGGTEEESASNEDRDADGRQAWVRFGHQTPQEEDRKEKSIDTTGQIGNSLDLSG